MTLEGAVDLLFSPKDNVTGIFLAPVRRMTRRQGNILVLVPDDEKTLIRLTDKGEKMETALYHNTENMFVNDSELKIGLVFREIQTYSTVDAFTRQVLYSEKKWRFMDPEDKQRFNAARKIFNQHAENYCKLFLECSQDLA